MKILLSVQVLNVLPEYEHNLIKSQTTLNMKINVARENSSMMLHDYKQFF